MFESNEYFAANISKQKLLLICFPFLMFTFLVSGLKKKKTIIYWNLFISPLNYSTFVCV